MFIAKLTWTREMERKSTWASKVEKKKNTRKSKVLLWAGCFSHIPGGQPGLTCLSGEEHFGGGPRGPGPAGKGCAMGQATC